MSPGQPTGTCKETYSSLSQVALSARYQTLFNSGSFDTYLLTTYSLADSPRNGCAPDWYYGLSGGDASAEESEIAALASTLSAYYGGKKFILLNWEGDSAIGALAQYCNLALTPTMWTGYSQWITARGQGVLDARGQGVSNVYSGLEFNAVQRTPGDAYYGNICSPTDTTSPAATGCAPCDGASYPCVISKVAPGAWTIDYLSYSSWQSVGVSTSNDSDVAVRLQFDLATAQGLVPGASPANFIVGEFGADRNAFGEARAATRMSFAVSGLTAFGASYGIYWQALDNAGGGGFGVFKPDGTESLQGQAIAATYGVDCAFSAPSTIGYGGDWPVSVTSNLQGYDVFWFGTANGRWDANNAYSGTVTSLYQDYGPYYDEGDTFTRYAVMEDGSGNAICTTNTIQASVQ